MAPNLTSPAWEKAKRPLNAIGSHRFGWPNGLPNDGQIMRGLFYVMIAVIALALVHDFDALRKNRQATPLAPTILQPVLPAYLPPGSTDTQTTRGHPPVTADPETLRSALKIELGAGGTLQATGTIDPGSAQRFADEMNKVGEYVKRVELSSPGGSVHDALAISRLVRERKLDTVVRDGALCASSCPLIFAGGVQRTAGGKAAIGVHQTFIAQRELRDADNEVSGTQTLTAVITRHLESMGVDAAVWLHALETPPSQLYYFTPQELEAYKLATHIAEAPAA
ncbi:hypothetical protein [Salaquimonas pukyongi]|uniref:COG3904 family protein n=1 Tax=Salaquimonas pukyongi TaxID=2712698 RepID=UPI001FCDF76E|nr:hypothetical protein [Salaquimonas pukyongi]